MKHPVAVLPAQFAPRSSIGVRNYAESLAQALAGVCGRESPVLDSPRHPRVGGHFHIANSTRRLLPFLLKVSEPVLLTIHDLVPRARLLRVMLPPVQYRLLRRFPAVVHSEDAKEWLLSRGLHRDAQVIPHAADHISLPTGKIAQIRSSFMGESRLLLVCAGILNRQKMIPDIIKAVSRIPRLALLLSGRIADAETRKALDAAGINVHHLPEPDDRIFREVIAAADYLLNFRRESVGESSGPVALAHAAGVPVLGYAIGAQAEFGSAADELFPLDVPIVDCLRRIAEKAAPGPLGYSKVFPPTWAEAAVQYLEIYRRHGLLGP